MTDTLTRASQPEDAGAASSDVRAALLARAEAVAQVAGEHAADVDRQARFPAEALAALREQRLMNLLIPREEGGEGTSISEAAAVVEVIARACANTAMVLAMHYNQLAGLTRHADNEAFAAHRRRIAQGQLLIASSTTEIGIGGDVRRSTCAVEPDEGGRFQLTKNAPVISYAEYADVLLITARRNPDAAPNDQVLVLVDTTEVELEKTGSWDTLGFRGTCSPGYILKTTGTVDNIFPEPFSDISAHTMLPCSHIFWSSVWLGIAKAAVGKARGYVQKAARKKPGTVPPGALRLAELQIEVESFTSTVTCAAHRMDAAHRGSPDLESVSFAIAMNGLKVFASTKVVDIVGRAMIITGIEGYREDSPLAMGRYLRDAYGAALMINNDRILGHTASLELINRGGK